MPPVHQADAARVRPREPRFQGAGPMTLPPAAVVALKLVVMLIAIAVLGAAHLCVTARRIRR